MEYFLGIVVSLIIQFFKGKASLGEYGTLAAVAVLSFAAAAGYVFAVDTSIWPTVVTILTTSGAFYSFFLMRFASNKPE